MLRLPSLAVGLATLGSTAAARARPPAPAPPRVVADVAAGTAFPLDVGVSTRVEVPGRVLLGLELGVMPRPYAYTIDDVLRVFGAYDSTVSTLIREGLDDSFVLRPSVGWRPFPALGLELLGGYTLLALGGGLSGSQVIETVTGRAFPGGTGSQIPLHSTLHNVHAEAAWRFAVGEHWAIRASLGVVHCVASSSGIDVHARTRAGQAVVDQIDGDLDRYLNDVYTTYVYAPLLGASVGYRF